LAEVRAVMRDAARLTRKSYWRLAGVGVEGFFRRRDPALAGEIGHDRSFLSEDIRQHPAVAQEDHPWMRRLQTVAPGKRLQIVQLIELLQRHAPIARDIPAPDVHPLTSLPLIELCLSMPTWVLLRGGRNRALARLAFADGVPAAIRDRESKGNTGLFVMNAVRRQSNLITTLLLEGQLARAGWIDRGAVERHLVQRQPLKGGQLMSLLACLAAEVWLSARKARQRSYCAGSSGSAASIPCSQN
jgi:asparagine synthase (glutamine-hydrolysing)